MRVLLLLYRNMKPLRKDLRMKLIACISEFIKADALQGRPERLLCQRPHAKPVVEYVGTTSVPTKSELEPSSIEVSTIE